MTESTISTALRPHTQPIRDHYGDREPGDSTADPARPGVIDRRHKLIDHILASHALIRTSDDAPTVDLDAPFVGPTRGMALRIDPPSDHRAVVAHFELR